MPGEPSLQAGIRAGCPPAGSKHGCAWLETSLALVPACRDTLPGTDPEGKKKKKHFTGLMRSLKEKWVINLLFRRLGLAAMTP